MKLYKDYIDNISVDDNLHYKIMAAVTSKPRYCSTLIRRYATVFACLIVMLLGTLTVAKLLPYGTITPPKNQFGVITPSNTKPSITSPNDTQSSYTIVFTKVAGNISYDKGKIRIPGHFWEELPSEVVSALFPEVTGSRTLEATANFTGDGTLYNIESICKNNNGIITNITIQKGTIALDKGVSDKPTTSDVYVIPVTAFYWEDDDHNHYYASFELNGVGYSLNASGDETAKDELSALVGFLIKGGAPDLDAITPTAIPELREDALTLDEARSDTDFGAYIPINIPAGFNFESSMRFKNQERNNLRVTWVNGMDYIEWKVSYLMPDDKPRITSTEQTENYDLSLYPIPHAQSVPAELRKIVTDPIFRIEELTREVVMTRAYKVNDAGDTSGYRMRFSVLYGDILVVVNIKGADPESVYNMLLSLADTQ
ncbi:MAG: hypothetical protein GX257_07495 [Clostridiales bacterium]|nr:hypothetical protein [Clostridiales bacterium]HHT94304.1 hypothetical protein [Clostridiaceae bacterium]